MENAAIVTSVACVVVSSLTTTFGLFFQKIAMERAEAYSSYHDEIPNPGTFVCVTRLIWIAGFLCITVFSFLLDMYSFSTLGQAMVVPLLASLEVAENQMFAPFVLGEHFDKLYDISASVCCIVGAMLTTLFGPGGPFGGDAKAEDWAALSFAETKSHFGELFTAPLFIGFEVLSYALFVCSVYFSRIECCRHLHFLMFGYMAGFLGGQQNMFLKGAGTFIKSATEGNTDAFLDWLVYLFIAGMVGFASAQLYFLNQGLVKFDALLFVPTYTILYIAQSTLVGLVFYQEYRLMSSLGWCMFGLGFLCIGGATAILGMKPAPLTFVDVIKPEIEISDGPCSESSTSREVPSPKTWATRSPKPPRESIIFSHSHSGFIHISSCISSNHWCISRFHRKERARNIRHITLDSLEMAPLPPPMDISHSFEAAGLHQPIEQD